MSKSYMRGIDVCVAVLLVIGGLNWGLVAFFGFDLVAYLFGSKQSCGDLSSVAGSVQDL
jgi:uncharacterized membrane protein YuzA (DUF378 family)